VTVWQEANVVSTPGFWTSQAALMGIPQHNYHNAYHNPARVSAGLRRLSGSEKKTEPRKMGFVGSCRTWIRTFTN
jgi:hypothetical protein